MQYKYMFLAGLVLIVITVVPASVGAKYSHTGHTKLVATSTVASSGGSIVVQSGSEQILQAYITGYSYWDNTPAGSAAISNPVIHKVAGGTGSYNDPITLAVGHSIVNGKDILDYPAGTRFYLSYLKKYAIVEDTCCDGSQPQNGPCHTGYKSHPWVDLYVDGQTSSAAAADACMNKITNIETVIENPVTGYPVVLGSVMGSGCVTY
jgi:hypothetical protein